ncbi:hypothetical protein [Pengzhenrongella frigida]|uniref:LPXTG cell wall anchor domain-containing protein n=1 Tax=Pengzhenrongella frigida TaxID=1259133 RepID=A0A4Q5MX77_9MICO|nr:hypothetical protein [Cellulomonas sp. HLT2-17]RYV50205.1 hypothetical protein EUA98_14805 [Cellulomonas sp. HLT2-17]
MRKTTAVLFFTSLLLPASLATAAGASAASLPGEVPAAGACADASGVTVVVDLTDLGGDVVVSCADGDPATGRQALVDAGFTVADSTPGMICAINAAPDPCPETFDGSYWSYWSAEADADWTAYAVGAGSSDPVPGAFEGWRYNDGSTGPGLAPAALEAADPAAGAATETAAPAAPVAADPSDESGSSSWATVAGLGVLAVLLASVLVMVRRRRAAGQPDDDGRG